MQRSRKCFRTGVLNNQTVAAVFEPEYLPSCTATDFALVTESGNVTLCANQVSPGIFAFNGLQDSTVAVEIIGVFQIVYTDLEAHDTIESALFTIILILGLVVWTGATKGVCC